MKLVFQCLVTGRQFWTDQWYPEGSMPVREEKNGRVLEGTVAVVCPECGRTHRYSPAELSCPLSTEDREE
ncbi:MAG: hypothetical protein ACLFTB_04165 [Desulfovibrionales bacterium]